MAHTIEPAVSGRARCRGCGEAIAKGELRFGERLPNPFADEGDMTVWFHLPCAAWKRPEPLLDTLRASEQAIERKGWLAQVAETGLEHRRLPRVDGAERASTGRATCRSCRGKIARDSWRIRLVSFEEGMFNAAGFIHSGCAQEYLGTRDLLERLRHFTPDLGDDDAAALASALEAPSGA